MKTSETTIEAEINQWEKEAEERYPVLPIRSMVTQSQLAGAKHLAYVEGCKSTYGSLQQRVQELEKEKEALLSGWEEDERKYGGHQRLMEMLEFIATDRGCRSYAKWIEEYSLRMQSRCATYNKTIQQWEQPVWKEREVVNGKSGRWMWHPTFDNGKPAQIFILDAPPSPLGQDREDNKEI